MSLLSLKDAAYRYPGAGKDALAEIEVNVERPQVIAIAGPNGSGKSTLLDLIAGLKTTTAGTCRLLGRPTQDYNRRDLCRIVAHVPQRIPQGIPFTVEEVVLTGRTPYGRGLYDNPEDLAIAGRALQIAGIDEFRHRRYAALSGGEQQRVLLAAAICQEPEILLLDEPGAHLDPRNESWLWTLLRQLSAQGRLVIVVTHHLALAARHADRVWLLDRGRLAADGSPAVAFHPAKLSEVFGVPFYGHTDPQGRVYLSYGT